MKTAATAQIGGLFRRVQHLPVLLQHPSLLSILARCLREDGRWSLDLSIHILSTFFALSQFSQFHTKLLELRVGAAAMDTLELALRRVDHREVSGWPPQSGKHWLLRIAALSPPLLSLCDGHHHPIPETYHHDCNCLRPMTSCWPQSITKCWQAKQPRIIHFV